MNKPTAIISCDNNPEYLFLLPIVCESWSLQGWKVLLHLTEFNNSALISVMPNNVRVIQTGASIFNSINKSLYSQVLRLYMPWHLNDEDYFILSDADMFIASDFLNRDYDKVNVFGHDLTGFKEIPICYVGATAGKWKQVMGENGMSEDVMQLSKYDSKIWHEAWGADQQILSSKIFGYQQPVNKINRGIDVNNLNLPLGRWDRYGNFRKLAGKIHDVHLMREPLKHIDKLIEICTTCYPKENWNWIKQYGEEFKKFL